MSLCSCPERPKCQCDWCDYAADFSVWQPAWPSKRPDGSGGRPERYRFMCDWHFQAYRKPIPGIDKPEGADEDWKPSLMDCIRLAQIAIAFEKRNERRAPDPISLSRPDDAKRYSPAQLKQVLFMRKRFAEFRRGTQP